jgi:hypothetical protein
MSTICRAMRCVAAVFALLATALACPIDSPAARAQDAAVDVGAQQPGVRRALIICGHPGDEEHRTLFAETLGKLRTALIDRYRFSRDAVWITFGGDELAGDPPTIESVHADSRQESLGSTVEELRAALQPDDVLWVIVLGHTHYDGRRVWLNLPGPDLNEQTFAPLFEGLACREQVFWITTPASGFYIKSLAAPGRVIISATEADREINETTFPHVMADVLTTPPAEGFDADEDGRATLFDLYIAVTRTIAQRYADDMQLSTEHALLEDNGDGRGSELQIDYLTEELGGRAQEGVKPPARLENADGNRAAAIELPEPPPMQPAETPAENAESAN